MEVNSGMPSNSQSDDHGDGAPAGHGEDRATTTMNGTDMCDTSLYLLCFANL